MRVTVCELPHEPGALAAAWAALCEHTVRHASELVLLPEFAMVDPVWQDELFDAARWAAAQALSEAWLVASPSCAPRMSWGPVPSPSTAGPSTRGSSGPPHAASDAVAPQVLPAG